jgi:hypothetical protein
MKNIFLLPTDKPSRLHKAFDKTFILSIEPTTKNDLYDSKPQNIYITDNSEIKEGDWTLMFDDFGNLFLCDKPQQYLGIEKGHHLNKGLKKIILTNDLDLIKDGIQPIDDEFLEWFVKNPSCEFVEVEESLAEDYLIIIPKEEPKQGTMSEAIKQVINNQLEQETLEALARTKFPYELFVKVDVTNKKREAFIEGYKLAQEQDKNKYSEEDVLKVLSKFRELRLIEFQEWFEQYKKK